MSGSQSRFCFCISAVRDLSARNCMLTENLQLKVGGERPFWSVWMCTESVESPKLIPIQPDMIEFLHLLRQCPIPPKNWETEMKMMRMLFQKQNVKWSCGKKTVLLSARSNRSFPCVQCHWACPFPWLYRLSSYNMWLWKPVQRDDRLDCSHFDTDGYLNNCTCVYMIPSDTEVSKCYQSKWLPNCIGFHGHYVMWNSSVAGFLKKGNFFLRAFLVSMMLGPTTHVEATCFFLFWVS